MLKQGTTYLKTSMMLLMLLTISACSSFHVFDRHGESVLNFIYANKRGNSVTYLGKIHKKGFEELKHVFEQTKLEHGKVPHTLRISSWGGSSQVGLAMGKWVRDNQLNVSVLSKCASACANYIFVAGVKKILREDSILMWHGVMLGMSAETTAANVKRIEKQMLTEEKIDYYYTKIQLKPGAEKPTRAEFGKEFRKSVKTKLLKFIQGNRDEGKINQMIKSRQDFYASIKTDPMIGDYGYLQRPNFADEGLAGYYYSLEDLAYLGVKNIELKDGKWQPDIEGELFIVEREYFKNGQTNHSLVAN